MISRSQFSTIAFALLAALPLASCTSRDANRSIASTQSAALSSYLSDGEILRSFFHDMVEASGAAPGDEPEAVKRALARHPEILVWAAEGRDLRQVLVEADLAPPAVPGEKPLSEIATEFIEKRGRDILDQQGFRGPLARMLRAKAGSAASVANNPDARDAARKQAVAAAKKFSELSFETRVQILGAVEDRIYVDAVRSANEKLAAAKVSDVEAFRSLLKNSAQFDLDGVDPEAITHFIAMYLDELAPQDRRKVMKAYLSLPPRSSVPDQLSAVVNNLPPTIQKLFQLIGKDATSPAIQKVMKKILDDVQPFTDPIVPILEKAYGKPVHEVFNTLGTRPIAAGTIGQVYFAELKDGTQVVIKIRRPGLEDTVQREMAALDRILEANRKMIESDPRFAEMARTGIIDKLVDRLKDTTLRELDFKREARLLDRATSYVDPKLGIDVVRRPNLEPKDNILLMTRAQGVPLSKMGTQDLEIQQKALYNLLRKWLDLALFEGVVLDERDVIPGAQMYGEPMSFFHADIHGGNMFLKTLKEDSLTEQNALMKWMIRNRPKFLLTLIDFGNSGEMKLSMRRSFVGLAAGAMTGSPEEIAKGLRTLGSMTDEQEAKIIAELKELDFSKLTVNARLQAAMQSSFKNGFDIPESITQLLRGKVFLESELYRVNEEIWINKVTKILEKSEPGLTLELRRALSQFLVGSMSGSVTTTMDGLEVLATMTPEQKAAIDAALDEALFSEMKLEDRLPKALEIARAKGASLNDGSEALISRHSRELSKLEKLSNVKYTANRAYLEVVAKRVGVSLPSQLFNQSARDTAVVELKVLADAVKKNRRKILDSIVDNCIRAPLKRLLQ